MRTILIFTCTVLVPSDSTTVTVDWYWRKDINECGRNITEDQGTFDIYTSRGYVPEHNTDHITTDLIIESPQTDIGYYWCQVTRDSTTVTVDWYWSKTISKCERNITEEQGYLP